MDYQEQWQPRTDQLLAEAFKKYRDGSNWDLHYFIDDQVSGMHQGEFHVPRSDTKGNPHMRDALRKTLPDSLRGFDPEKTAVRLEWR